MISILIPIFNCKVSKLVETLLEQSRTSNITIEIICLDDGSRPSIKKDNEHLRHKFSVNYVELSENIGRAKIRNWLARLARYEYLLFLDCDSLILNHDFLENYCHHLKENDVIYGGRVYSGKPPRSLKKRLHWKYGKEVESQSANKRNSKPYLSFMSNNFIIQKDIFKDNQFDESISGYGYEDTVFSFSLKNNNIVLYHINNPVIHNGIETTEVFLKKTETAIKNLFELYSNNKINNTRLIEKVEFLSRWKADNLTLKLLKNNSNKIINQLYQKDPKLIWFSLYKLHLFLLQKFKNP